MGSVKIAARQSTPEDIQNLRALVDDQRLKLGDNQAFIEADIAFHVGIAKLTSNPLLEAVTQAMLSWLFEHYKPLLHWSGRKQTTLLEHEHLVDIIEEKNAEKAEKIMRDHLNRSDPLYETN